MISRQCAHVADLEDIWAAKLAVPEDTESHGVIGSLFDELASLMEDDPEAEEPQGESERPFHLMIP